MCNKCRPDKCQCSKLQPHPHRDLIIAWANGAKIQTFYPNRSEWVDVNKPAWINNVEYRIKPEPKPDLVRYMRALCPSEPLSPHEASARGYISWPSIKACAGDNLRLIFDGETLRLKSVEIIGD